MTLRQLLLHLYGEEAVRNVEAGLEQAHRFVHEVRDALVGAAVVLHAAVEVPARSCATRSR